MPITAGSDLHITEIEGRVWPIYGIETDTRLETVEDYIELIRHGAWSFFGVPDATEPLTEAGVPIRVVQIYRDTPTVAQACEMLPSALHGNVTK